MTEIEKKIKMKEKKERFLRDTAGVVARLAAAAVRLGWSSSRILGQTKVCPRPLPHTRVPVLY